MAWDDEQWAFFVTVLRRGFASRDPMDEADEDVYRFLLRDVDPADAMRAVEEMVLDGQALRPRPGEVAARCRRDPSAPTWEEARELVFGDRGILRTMAARRLTTMDLLRGEFHPLALSFVDRMGPARLAAEPVHDPEYGALRLRDLRGAWERHCEALEGREVAALARGEGRAGLRRLDPLAALGVDREERPALGDGS